MTIPSSLDFYDLDILKITGQLCCMNDPQVRFVWCFLMLRLMLYPSFARISQKRYALLSASVQRLHYVGMSCYWWLTLITHGGVCQLPLPCSYHFSFYKIYISGDLGRDTLRLCKYTIFPQTFVQYFDIHLWILPGTIITEMFTYNFKSN